MAKILVADDNSNIQRMVGLALKDQGIEVVAVGNGEAAVRKISELRPDLVLADVFMPVRNGYEVCQYVKEDEALKHIPVILLVGAFDPLDEQEAQRVGADGVLKKPFVPPDPLIAMVKAALERAGVTLSPTDAAKTAPVPARKAADLLPPAQSPPAQSAPAQSVTSQRPSPLAGISFSGSSAPPPIVPVVADESFVDTPAVQAPVNAEAARRTIAFGNLLSSAPAADDPGFSAEDMEAVTAKDWRSMEEPADVPEEEDEESKESAPSWRPEESENNFGGEDGVGPVRGWRDSAEVEPVGRKSAREVWEQAEEKDGFAKATDVPSAMASFTSELTALEAETAEAKNQASGEPGLEAAPQIAPQAATFPGETALAEVDAAPEITAMSLPMGTTEEVHGHDGDQFVSETRTAEVSGEPVATGEPAFVTDMPAPVEVSAERTDPKSASNSWFSTPSSPWDTDAQQGHKVAASWDGGTAAPESGAAAADNAPETHSNGESSHEEVTAVLADEPSASVSAPEVPAAPQVPGSEAEMDALIAKVLARLNPEVLNAVAQQILKPAVAAILADELKSKK